MKLLSQDVVLAIWWALETPAPADVTNARMSEALGISASQVFASVRRCAWSHLTVTMDLNSRTIVLPHRENLLEFVIHGVKYAFAAERGASERGVPTLRGAPIFRAEFGMPEQLLVWPHPDGSARGDSLSPLHKIVPKVALENPRFHDALALIDAIRAGDARERKFGEKMIAKMLNPTR